MLKNVWRGATILVLTFLLGACACTDVGCFNSVSFSESNLVAFAGSDSFMAELCIDGACYDMTVDSGGAEERVVFEVDGEIRGPVKLTATSEDGTVTATGADLLFTVSQPNGRFCEPTCQSATVEIVDGTIRNT